MSYGICYMKLIAQIFLTALILSSSILAADSNLAEKMGGTIERIDQLYIDGKINYGDKLFYNLQSIYSTESLPENIRADSTQSILLLNPIFRFIMIQLAPKLYLQKISILTASRIMLNGLASMPIVRTITITIRWDISRFRRVTKIHIRYIW